MHDLLAGEDSLKVCWPGSGAHSVKMPSKQDYQKYKDKYGEAYLKAESKRIGEWVKKNRDRFNARRRNNLRSQLSRIKKQAKDRGYVVELADAEMEAMLKSPCVYCGTPPDPFNTIDRLDNRQGYVAGNVSACCKTCNMMKGCLDPQTFIERCAHISSCNGGPGKPCSSWANTSPKGVTMQICTRSARKKGLEFGLTEEEYNALTSGTCVFCHRPSTDEHKNGIDRVDPASGYLPGNCVTCCGQCNIAKKRMSADEFVARARDIAGRDHADYSSLARCLHIITRRKC